MLSTEELLKPRGKVIAPFPNMNFLGDSGFSMNEIFYPKDKHGKLFFNGYNIADYPHLFKILEWHEERAKNNADMPEYIKCIKTPDQIHLAGEIYKVKWNTTWGYDNKTEMPVILQTNCYLPATREEYEQYLSQQTKIK